MIWRTWPKEFANDPKFMKFVGRFSEIHFIAATADPAFGKFGRFYLAHCPEIDRARAGGNRRAYMHADHHDGVICSAKAAMNLVAGYQYGLFLHEFGHLLTPGGTEQDADRAAFEKFGIPIVYRSEKHVGRNVEWADPELVKAAIRKIPYPMPEILP